MTTPDIGHERPCTRGSCSPYRLPDGSFGPCCMEDEMHDQPIAPTTPDHPTTEWRVDDTWPWCAYIADVGERTAHVEVQAFSAMWWWGARAGQEWIAEGFCSTVEAAQAAAVAACHTHATETRP